MFPQRGGKRVWFLGRTIQKKNKNPPQNNQPIQGVEELKSKHLQIEKKGCFQSA